MNISKSLDNISGALKGVVSLGLSLAVVALMVDLLFPNTTHIVDNVAGLVNSFVGHGLVGLIALIIFVSIYDKG